MAYEDDGLSISLKLFEFRIALCLEKYISNGQRLVDDQNLRVNVYCNCKSKTHKHTAGVGLYGLIYIVSDIGKFKDLGEFFLNLLVRKAHHRSVKIYVLNAGVLHIKTGSKFKER